MMTAKISEFGFIVKPDLDSADEYHRQMPAKPRKPRPENLPELRAQLAANIRAALEITGTTERDLSKEIGYGTVYRLLKPNTDSGSSKQQIDTLLAVANYLKVKVWQLLTPDYRALSRAQQVADDWMRLEKVQRDHFAGLIAHAAGRKTNDEDPVKASSLPPRTDTPMFKRRKA